MEDFAMKKILAFALVFALVLSLGVMAFADSKVEMPDSYKLYNAADEVIGEVPLADATKLSIAEAGQLPAEEKAAFEKVYEDVKKIQDWTVCHFFWFDIPASAKSADMAYLAYYFTCSGKQVRVTVNEKPVEVVHVVGNQFCAKLPEFGAVAIMHKDDQQGPKEFSSQVKSVAPDDLDYFFKLYNKNDELIGKVPVSEATRLGVRDVNSLKPEQREAFLKEYENVKNIKDKVVRYFFWFDIPDNYKTDDLAYLAYYFNCSGENPAVTVNGQSMEVVPVVGNEYMAKIADFGSTSFVQD